jgi:hypothetical protein
LLPEKIVMSDSVHSAEKPAAPYLVLHVRYLGAHHQFVDDGAARTETLAALLPRVLEFFRLGDPGGQKIYVFAHDGEVLRNTSTTLGELAKGHEKLKLDLVEQFEQG